MIEKTGLHITVAVSSSPGISLDKEFQLLKTALLYGDKVTLCSPKASMLRGLFPLAGISVTEMFDLVGRILPHLSEEQRAGATPEMIPIIKGFAEKVKGPPKGLTLKERQLRGQMLSVNRQVIENFQRFFDQSGTSSLLQVVNEGKVELYTFEGYDTKVMVAEFVRRVGSALADGSTYPLLDARTGNLMQAFAKENEEVGVTDIERMKHVAIADDLFRRLPGLDNVTLDEVIDIRGELEAPLIRFRAGIIDVSTKIQSASWDTDFPKEVDLLVRSVIEPALLEIEEQIKVIPALASYFTRPKDVLKSALSGATVGVLIAKHWQLESLTYAAFGAGASTIASALQAIRESREKASKNQMFFYYKVRDAIE